MKHALCGDSKCLINKHAKKLEDLLRVGRVENAIKEYKKEHGIDNFSKFNIRG